MPFLSGIMVYFGVFLQVHSNSSTAFHCKLLVSGMLFSEEHQTAKLFHNLTQVWFSCCLFVVASNARQVSFILHHVKLTIFPVIMLRKSLKSIAPEPSLSMSAIIFLISSFFGSKPRALIATCGTDATDLSRV